MDRLGTLFAIDLRSLAAFRVMCAVTVIWMMIVIAPDLRAFYSDDGVLSRELLAAYRPVGYPALTRIFGGVWLAWALWGAALVSALALLVGWRGRAAAAFAFFAVLALTGRNPLVTQGGDALIVLLLFWAMWLPVSAVWSVDAAFGPDRRGEKVASIAGIGLLLQVLYVYVFGALLKTSSVWVPDGAAVYVALHLDSFATPLAHWFRQFAAPMAALTLFVFWIELLAPVLLFFPDRHGVVRSATLALLMCMHVGFRVFLNVGHFWLASLASLCAYIPTSWWRRAGAAVWSGDRYQIWYDRDCGFCLRTALVLREFCLPRDTPVRAAQSHPKIGPLLEREDSWVLVDPAGRRRLGWDAVCVVLMAHPLTFGLGLAARGWGLIGLGEPTYRMIGNARWLLGPLTRPRWRWDPPRWTRWPRRALLIFAIGFAFLWNLLDHAPGLRVALPEPVREAGRALGFAQHWNMFAPAPPVRDGYPVAVATDSEGREWDIFRDPPAPVDFTRPLYMADAFPSHRWRRYANHLLWTDAPTRGALIEAFSDYLCRRANEGERRFDEVRLVWLTNETGAAYASTDGRIETAPKACP